MPVKRRGSKAKPYRITSEVLALFSQCVEIEKSGCDEFFENDGGRRREYLDAVGALHMALGLKPWQPSPLDRDLAGDPPFGGPELCRNIERPFVLEIRKEILRALKRGPAKA